MITVKPTEEQKQAARKLANDIGNLPTSFLNGARTYEGMVGEKVVADLIRCNHKPSYEYDLILEDGRTVDCKTFSSKYIPRDNFECHVTKKARQQTCDMYLFSGYNKEKGLLHICGYMPRDEFYSIAKEIKKGERSDINNIRYRADGYIIKVGDLYPVEDLL